MSATVTSPNVVVVLHGRNTSLQADILAFESQTSVYYNHEGDRTIDISSKLKLHELIGDKQHNFI